MWHMEAEVRIYNHLQMVHAGADVNRKGTNYDNIISVEGSYLLSLKKAIIYTLQHIRHG